MIIISREAAEKLKDYDRSGRKNAFRIIISGIW